jgi:hypothetical protein
MMRSYCGGKAKEDTLARLIKYNFSPYWFSGRNVDECI